MKKRTKKFFSKEQKNFKDSFRNIYSKRFLAILIIDILLILSIFAGVKVWGSSVESLTPLMNGVSTAATSFKEGNLLALQPHTDNMQKFYKTIIFYSVLFIIYFILIWCLFKLLLYKTLNKKKLNVKGYWRFTLLIICWTIICGIILFIIQALLYRLIVPSIQTSLISKVILILVAGIVITKLIYFTTILLSLFIEYKLKKTLKTFFQCIKQFKANTFRIISMLIIFALMNLLMFIAGIIPGKNAFIIASTILVLVYFSWARIYSRDSHNHTKKKK